MSYRSCVFGGGQIRDKWEVIRIAIAHRLGVTEVKEASVIIAISSVHRKDSLEAVEYAINTLKATVPIWKLVGIERQFTALCTLVVFCFRLFFCSTQA